MAGCGSNWSNWWKWSKILARGRGSVAARAGAAAEGARTGEGKPVKTVKLVKTVKFVEQVGLTAQTVGIVLAQVVKNASRLVCSHTAGSCVNLRSYRIESRGFEFKLSTLENGPVRSRLVCSNTAGSDRD